MCGKATSFQNIKYPENKKEFCVLMQMLNFWSMYIPQSAILLKLLSMLLKKKKVNSVWEDEQKFAWE
jgi:hypothetical protein